MCIGKTLMHNIDKIILGTVQFGLNYGINNNIGQLSFQKVSAILDSAYNNGITSLDTAQLYGTSIDIISKFHSKRDFRFNVINKFQNINQNIYSVCLNELDKLSINNYESYLFHSFKDYFYSDVSVFNSLSELKKDKKINAIGVSVYTNEQFEQVIYDKRIDLIQFPYNVFDNDNKRKKIMALAKKYGKQLHARSIFLQGLIFKNKDHLPKNLKEIKPYIEQLEHIKVKYSIGFDHLAFAYVLQNKFIDKILIGIDSILQLESNIKLIKKINELPVPVDCIDEINKIKVQREELLNPNNW